MKEFVLFLCLFFTIACATTSPGISPKNLQDFYVKPTPDLTIKCREIAQNGDLKTAAAQRNYFIDQTVFGIDTFYANYQEQVIKGNATVNTFIDIIQSALPLVSMYTNNIDIIKYTMGGSAILAASRLAYDKNFLNNQGMAILLLHANVLRRSKWAEIEKKKLLSYEQYSIDAAAKDLRDYSELGTLSGALLNINE